jgi:hypothetical protein
MNRKQKREAIKNGENPLLEEKLFLFGKMGDKCNGCSKSFDKKDREQVNTWSVFVYNESQTVKVYCPQCRNDIQAWAEDIQKNE